MRDLAETASLTRVAGVDREPPERDDAGGVEHRSRAGSSSSSAKRPSSTASASESRPVRRSVRPCQVSNIWSPALPIALCGGETVGRDCQRLLVAVGGAEHLGVVHVR